MLLQTLIIRIVLIIRYFPSLFLKQWLNSHILLQFLWFSVPFLVLNKLVYVCILCVFYLIIIILQDNYTHRYPFRRENITWLKTPQEVDSTPRNPTSNVSTNILKNILHFI